MLRTILLVVFTLLVFNTKAGCVGGDPLDVIFMLDSSGSLAESDFVLQKEFAADLVQNYLPNNARVACHAFGSRSYTRNEGFYFGFDQVSGLSQDQIARMLRDNPQYNAGGTYLREAIKNLRQLNAIPNDGRDKLMIVITDGVFSDDPRDEKVWLNNRNVRVIVVGVGEDWDPNHADLVEEDYWGGPAFAINDVDGMMVTDVHQISAMSQVSTLFDQLGDFICTADHELMLSEIKPAGSQTFLEYINTGNALDASELGVKSNLIQGDEQTFSQGVTIPKDGTVYVGQTCPTKCSTSPSCICLAAQMKSVAVGSWTAEIFQVHAQTNKRSTVEIIEAAGTGFPTIADDYSLELIDVNNDNKLGSSWRRSCVPGGSPGVKNFDKCPNVCQSSPECSSDLSVKNTCILGISCECDTTGFLEDKTQCIRVPPVPSCKVWHVGNNDVIVRWEDPLFLGAKGFKIATPSTDVTDKVSFGWGEKQISNVQQNHWEQIDVSVIVDATVTETSIDIPHSRNVTDSNTGTWSIETTTKTIISFVFAPVRWSESKRCTVVKAPSMAPTPSPTNPTASPTTSVPSQAPSHPQPQAVLMGSASEAIVKKTSQYLEALVHLRNAPLVLATPIHFKFQQYRNKAWEDAEKGTVEFPANSLANGIFTVTARSQNVYPVGSYRVVLEKTTELDDFGREKYLLGPSSGLARNIDVTKDDAKTIIKGGLKWWVWVIIIASCLAVLFFAILLAYRYRVRAQLAKEEEKMAKQELEDEIRIGEEGLFHNAEATINPLFNKTTANNDIGVNDPQFAMIDADVDEFKFENKTEFGAVLKDSEVPPQAGHAIQVPEAGRPMSNSAEMENMWQQPESPQGSYNAQI